MQRFWTILAVAALTLGGLALADGEATTYTPPYPPGPSGGDSWNLVQADDEGRIVVGRAYPVISVLSCSAAGGYITYEIAHDVTAPADAVTIDFSEAVLDPYVFATVVVIDDDDRFLGSFKQRGELVGDGRFEIPLTWPTEETFRERTIRIQFGMELTTACPSADAGTMRFDAVTIS